MSRHRLVSYQRSTKLSHLLASVNREAAERIQPEPAKAALPGVGEMVVYHMRPGHGRNGKTFFPAIVQGHGDRGTLMLTVIIDAGDLCDESLVEERRVGTEFHCWERVDRPFPVAEDVPPDDEAHEKIASLEKAVFGEFARPPVSICAILADFEARLAQLQADSGKVNLPDLRKGKGK